MSLLGDDRRGIEGCRIIESHNARRAYWLPQWGAVVVPSNATAADREALLGRLAAEVCKQGEFVVSQASDGDI